MAQVPERVLSWLHNVLHEYRDQQRTYLDVVRVLSHWPSLSPRTEVYTTEHGASALLLTLSGTLPTPFRGTTYRYPVKLWIPQHYPQEGPHVYITPGKDMVIRPGQHVAVDGRVFHPYLGNWSNIWDRASMSELLNSLVQVFARDPPVISRAHQQQLQRPLAHEQPQAVSAHAQYAPQLPPKPRIGSPAVAEMPGTNTPPPRPPKPGEEYADDSPRNVERDGPPLPPLPHFASTRQQPGGQYPESRFAQRFSLPAPMQALNGGRSPAPQPLPLQPQRMPQHPNREASPVSPVSPVASNSRAPVARFSYHAVVSPPQSQRYAQNDQRAGPPPQHLSQTPAYQPGMTPGHYQTTQPAQTRIVPAPDLLSDPFDVAIPGSTPSATALEAPPIPPNPEKEHLLQAASAMLVQQAHQRVQQVLSAVPPLQAQQQALHAAHGRLDAEIRQLEQLEAALSNNETILHRSTQDCDQTILTAKSKRRPNIDEVLIAPTMVANQLWTLCAEEAACREAMYMLQKAVDRGRVSANDFIRQMRGLGRECFLKMALARKCAQGMGLEVDPWTQTR